MTLGPIEDENEARPAKETNDDVPPCPTEKRPRFPISVKVNDETPDMDAEPARVPD